MAGNAFSFTTLPTSFGQGGANLAPNDAQGNPSLYTILLEFQTQLNKLASISNGYGASMLGVEDTAGRITATQVEAALAEVAGRVLNAAADETAIKAIPATARANGTMVLDLTNDVIWTFDSGSSAGGSAWVLVPDAGTGRWVRKHASLADLAAVTGAALVGSNAAGYIAATVAAQLAEVKAIADAGMPCYKKTVTIGHADLTDDVDGEAQVVPIGTALPSNARIVGVSIHGTPFSGGSVASVTCKIGTSGDDDAIVASADLMTAFVDGECSAFTWGIAPHKLFAAGAQLNATLTPDGAHDLEDLTAGSVVVDVLYIILA